MIPTKAFIHSAMIAVVKSEFGSMRAHGFSPAPYDLEQVETAATSLYGSIKSRVQDFVSGMVDWDSLKEPKVFTSVDLEVRGEIATFDFSMLFPPRLVVPITVTQVCHHCQVNT